MKRLINTSLIVLVMIISTSVKAATLTDEEYSRLKLLFTDARISVMSDEEAQKYLSFDLEHTEKISKFYKVTATTNGTTTSEVTESEAVAASENIIASENNSARATYVTTSYKKLEIAKSQSVNNDYLIDLINIWLTTPAVTSYDVMAIRCDDATMVAGTQDGTQIYKKNGSYQAVDYSYNGTNMKLASNGFGISMNLVDGATDYENYLSAVVTSTSTWATIYGSYQHAAAKVTLAQSQSYTISHNGYGEVINFATGIQNTYDGMQGVKISLGYTA